MYVVTGATGKVGGGVARTLRAAGLPVRAILRDPTKVGTWLESGFETAIAELSDEDALARAFNGASAVFVMTPSMRDATPDFSEARAMIAMIRSAVERSRPARVVCLSTTGAKAPHSTTLDRLGIMEDEIGTLSLPTAFLRAAWFMENVEWDIAAAKDKGVVPSFLQPLDRPFPMVSVVDVGRLAAELMRETWVGTRITELEGPWRVTPAAIADALADELGHPVRTEILPREGWESIFREQGMKNPFLRMRMIDGFNEGWVEFDEQGARSIKGDVDFRAALKALIQRSHRGVG
jgi:uncharacterized protein YbjT (DUF2867 family)